MDRMQSSATYFDFNCDPTQIESALVQLTERIPQQRHRIRVSLRRDGRFQISESSQLSTIAVRPVKIVLASEPIDKNDPFMYHRTTRRHAYERALRIAGDTDDVLLWNGDGYITETTIANVIARIDGELCTPPVDCGLLGGTYREYMLGSGKVRERKIKVGEVNSSTEIILINSVRGAYSGHVSDSVSQKYAMSCPS